MKTNRSIVILIALIAILLLGIAGYVLYQKNIWPFHQTATGTDNTAKQIEKENLRLAYINVPKAIYPANEADTVEISIYSNVFQTLVEFDRENIIKPALAEKWDNPDSLTWRFYLSPGAVFSDKTPVTAEDVKFTYDYINSSSLKMKSLLPPAKEVKVISSGIVEFKTEKPDPLFLNRLANNVFILSKKNIEASGLSSPIGSGPYKIVELVKDKSIKLTLNENYWRTPAKVRNVEFIAMPDETARISALLDGSIDMAFYTQDSKAKIDAAVAAKTITTLNISHGNSVEYLALDTTRSKTPYVNTPENPLKDVRVRKAIYQAINIDELIGLLPGPATSSNQIVSKSIAGYNPLITRPEYNLTQARALLADAGYPNGFNITMDYYDIPKNRVSMENIAKQLGAINITVKLNVFAQDALDQFYSKIDARDTSVYKTAYAPDSKDAAEILAYNIHSLKDDYGIYNLGYSNSTVDQLIESADTTLSQEERLNKLQEAMRLSMDEVAVVPLFEFYNTYAYDRDIYWKPRADGNIKLDELAGLQQ